MLDFNRSFFRRHQRKILTIANLPFARRLLGLHRLPKDLRGKKIAKIEPSSFHVEIGKNQYRMYAFTRPRFAESLAYNLSPFAYLQYRHASKYEWRFSPIGALAMIVLCISTHGSFFAIAATTSSYFAGAGDGSVLSTSTRGASSGNFTYTSDDRVTQDLNSPFRCVRGGFPIDTSGIDDAATVTAATFYTYITLLYQTASDYTISLVQSTQASTSSIATSDFSKLYGTLDSDTKLNSSDLVSSSMTNNAYNSMDLNATGLAYISKTGYTKFAVRSSYDIGNSATSTERQINCRFSQYTGTSYDPYISVTYSVSSAAFRNFFALIEKA